MLDEYKATAGGGSHFRHPTLPIHLQIQVIYQAFFVFESLRFRHFPHYQSQYEIANMVAFTTALLASLAAVSVHGVAIPRDNNLVIDLTGDRYGYTTSDGIVVDENRHPLLGGLLGLKKRAAKVCFFCCFGVSLTRSLMLRVRLTEGWRCNRSPRPQGICPYCSVSQQTA